MFVKEDGKIMSKKGIKEKTDDLNLLEGHVVVRELGEDVEKTSRCRGRTDGPKGFDALSKDMKTIFSRSLEQKVCNKRLV